MIKIALVVDNPLRDLAGLVLTALYLCQKGVVCYLVPLNFQNKEILALAPDFVLLNYIRVNNQEFVKGLLTAGIKVGVLDTEGGVFTSMDSYGKDLATDPLVRKQISCFCAWGIKLANYVIRKGFFSNNQVIITGHPRFDFYADIWREVPFKVHPVEMTVRDPIVLINGSFSLSNPGFNTPEAEARMLVEKFGHDKEEIMRRQAIEQKTMWLLVELTNNLAKHFPGINFVYRPHPFERISTYDKLFGNYKNVHLIKKGSVQGWILRAVAVIQRGCSTAIEAAMVNVPALSPVWIPTADVVPAVDAVSIPCESVGDIFEKIDMALSKKLQYSFMQKKNYDQIITDLYYKIDGKSHVRVGEAILNSIEHKPLRVHLDYCKKLAYSRCSVIGRIAASVRKKLNLPADWRFPPHPELVAGVPWANSEKYFDVEHIESLIKLIMANQSAKMIDVTKAVKIEYVRKRKDYLMPVSNGKSVAMFAAQKK